MQKRRRVHGFVALLLLLALAFPGAARADEIETGLKGLQFNPSVKAGESLTISANIQVDLNVGACCAWLTLEGPDSQHAEVRLELFGGGYATLRGTWTPSPHARPGAWKVSRLRLYDNDGRRLEYKYGDKGFSSQITVTASGKPEDKQGPKVERLEVTPEAESGEALTVSAIIKDDLSGVAGVVATVAPAGQEKPEWEYAITLMPTGKTDEFAGTMVMEADRLNQGKGEIIRLQMRDGAGNTRILERKEFAAVKGARTAYAGSSRKPPKALMTSPYITNVVHGGENIFWTWGERDANHLTDLLKQAASDPTSIRERVAAELPVIYRAISDVGKEIYVDKETGLTISPYPTTGKLTMLQTGAAARFYLLQELLRREGKLKDDYGELKADELFNMYQISDEEDKWADLQEYNEYFAKSADAILRVLAQSPEAVKVLKAPANEALEYGLKDHVNRQALYFTPIITNRRAQLSWGTGALTIPATRVSLTAAVTDLFYAVGQHFGQAYITSLASPDRPSRWGQYMALRGNQGLPAKIGFTGTPENNVGDDFAYAYLPMNLGQQFTTVQSYPALRYNPEMTKKFKALVEEKLKQPVAPLKVYPERLVEVGLTSEFQATVAGTPTSTQLVAYGVLGARSGPTQQPGTPSAVPGQTRIKAPGPEAGAAHLFSLKAQDGQQRTYGRYTLYYRAPVLLDPYPAATNKSTFRLSGTTVPSAVVTVGKKSAVSDHQGKFGVDLSLEKGENSFRVEVAGIGLAARLSVQYDPSESPVKLTVNALPVTADPYTWVSGKTEPYGMVISGSHRTQADGEGKFALYQTLDEGKNRIELTAVSPAGNRKTWKGTAVRDSVAPAVTVFVPVLTNQTHLEIVGKGDPDSLLTLDDEDLEFTANGDFRVIITLGSGETRALRFAATDAAGNQSALALEVTHTDEVPTFTRATKLTLTGKISPEFGLRFGSTEVKVARDGSFSVPVQVVGGRNIYRLLIVGKDGKGARYLEYVVKNPLVLEKPADLGDDLVLISGQTVPGYRVMIGNEVAQVNSTGSFSHRLRRNGQSSVEVTVRGDGETVRETVTLP